MSPTFIIYASAFDENSGGSIALHRLCDVLNQLGCRARIWPWHRPIQEAPPTWRERMPWVRRKSRSWEPGRFKLLGRLDTPLATADDLEDAIVVYPEVVAGNPLQAKRVVRWLLHKPGFHTGSYEFGPDDLFFFYQQAFNDPVLNPHTDRMLQTLFVRNDLYHPPTPEGERQRQGTCYILRKGKRRALVHDANGSVLIDGLSHAAAAEVFRRCETCISYDLYTMYSMYAAMCGCDSIVVPDPAIDLATWYPTEEERYGMAYGWEQLEWSRRTRPLLLPRLQQLEEASNGTVRHFIETCQQQWGLNLFRQPAVRLGDAMAAT
ncbi:hypothetical protein ACWA7J_21835 [Leptothrix sp. BB-4]